MKVILRTFENILQEPLYSKRSGLGLLFSQTTRFEGMPIDFGLIFFPNQNRIGILLLLDKSNFLHDEVCELLCLFQNNVKGEKNSIPSCRKGYRQINTPPRALTGFCEDRLVYKTATKQQM